jgi:hypothetical protein
MPDDAPVTTTVDSGVGAGRAMTDIMPMTSGLARGPRFVAPPPAIDLAFVDALMRRQLEARRRGRCVRLRNVPDDLRDLLELLGFAEVLLIDPGRKPEVGEELRVDEVVQARDAVV